uniref:Ragulator complex protein LAMTOR1 n=1 Tax=Parastrongyloides trichosuri TaxID=131310 RepID=A0A0N4ZFH4_PARTI
MTRSICACCQFLRKDKPIQNNEDLEAGVNSSIQTPNTIPIMLEGKNFKSMKETISIINENNKINNEVFHTARTAREDIVKDYRSMEQLVREIRLDHGIVDTPRLPSIDVTTVDCNYSVQKTPIKISNVSEEFYKMNSLSHSPSLGYHSGLESGISTPDHSQMSPNRQESGYESSGLEEISLEEKEVEKPNIDINIMKSSNSFYSHISSIPQNIYLLISYIYFWLVSTTFGVIKRVTG